MDFFGLGVKDMLGVSRMPQVLDMEKLRNLIVRADRKQVMNTIQEAIEKNKSWNIEYRIFRNNQTRWIREQGYPTKKNRKTVFDVFLQDVSEFKNISQKLNRKLEKANQRAGVKNEFFASISHEIRTPMNAVMGMAQILSKTAMDAEQKQYVTTIIDSTQSLVQIINDVLDFSKLEAGKVEIVNEEFDLEKLCLDVCHLLMSHASEKQLALYLDFKSVDQRKVIGDKIRIRQILVNLIGNAIKFTPNGFVKLQVNYLQNEFTPGRFQFRIEDTGIGISKAAQSQLFKAFAQANAQITKNFGGTGLGLRICQQLVTMMHGDIGVESIVNKGTTFWFTLPLPHCVEPPLDVSTLVGKKAIVVGNDLIVLDMITSNLTSWGVEVKTVEDSEDTLAMLAVSETCDFFVIDKELRGLDGLKLSSLIKRDIRYENIPILMLTSIAKKEKKSSFVDAGVSAYTTLPLSPSLLGLAACETLSTVKDNVGIKYIAPDSILGKNAGKFEKLKINGKVLIVDDIEVNRLILNSILSDAGLVTDFAENGKIAVDKIISQKFDMVFMDCRMPVMDGYEASRQIRKINSTNANLPIIALTANAGEQDRQLCLAAGMNDFLTKPFAESELMQVLRLWMPSASLKVVESEDVIVKPQAAFAEFLDSKQWDNMSKLMHDEFEQFVLEAMKNLTNYDAVLKEAFAAGDIRMLVEKSHALKGMSGLFGAIKVSQIAAKIEKAGNDKEFEVINLNLANLGAAIETTNLIMMKQINPDLDQSVILF